VADFHLPQAAYLVPQVLAAVQVLVAVDVAQAVLQVVDFRGLPQVQQLAEFPLLQLVEHLVAQQWQ
jgi:hypothetical protein